MPRLLKGRWVDDNLAVPLIEDRPLGLVSYKKARIERKQSTTHECEEK